MANGSSRTAMGHRLWPMTCAVELLKSLCKHFLVPKHLKNKACCGSGRKSSIVLRAFAFFGIVKHLLVICGIAFTSFAFDRPQIPRCHAGLNLFEKIQLSKHICDLFGFPHVFKDLRISKIYQDSTIVFSVLFRTIEIEYCLGPTRMIFNFGPPGFPKIWPCWIAEMLRYAKQDFVQKYLWEFWFVHVFL